MTLDELISEFDRGLRSLTGVSRMSRPMPEADLAQGQLPLEQEVPGATPEATELTAREKAHS